MDRVKFARQPNVKNTSSERVANTSSGESQREYLIGRVSAGVPHRMRYDAYRMRHDAYRMRHDAYRMRHDAYRMRHDVYRMRHDAYRMRECIIGNTSSREYIIILHRESREYLLQGIGTSLGESDYLNTEYNWSIGNTSYRDM
ncbi:hypothetical protein AVEN_45432-1 [Araneus ventricosus]|uniref:Uncharacterized protein n=1 Tax=Araneus ventricosus TaxID=182803 RepID=A0A4Y2S4A8_ARAVE|nr:hypothetical protein AVEN_45432-1 [Araneus ventricosus]